MMNLMWAADAAVKTSEMAVEVDDGLIRIGEMAKRHGVTLRTLRFYEDKGLLAPRREGSRRLYTRRDNARLKLILLGRKVGFPLREVKKMIDLYDPSGSNTRQLEYALDKSEKQLARLHHQRKAIDEAIAELTMAMNAVRSMLAGSSWHPSASDGSQGQLPARNLCYLNTNISRLLERATPNEIPHPGRCGCGCCRTV